MSLKQEIAAQLERNTTATIAIVQKHINALLSGLSGLAAEAGDAPTAAAPKGKAKAAKTAAAPKGKKGRKAKTPPHVNVDLAYEVSRLVAGLNAVGVANIAEALSKTTTELERPIAIALDRKWITKSGERRATQYHPGTLPSSKPEDAFAPAPKAAAAPPPNGAPTPVVGVPGVASHADSSATPAAT